MRVECMIPWYPFEKPRMYLFPMKKMMLWSRWLYWNIFKYENEKARTFIRIGRSYIDKSHWTITKWQVLSVGKRIRQNTSGIYPSTLSLGRNNNSVISSVSKITQFPAWKSILQKQVKLLFCYDILVVMRVPLVFFCQHQCVNGKSLLKWNHKSGPYHYNY